METNINPINVNINVKHASNFQEIDPVTIASSGDIPITSEYIMNIATGKMILKKSKI